MSESNELITWRGYWGDGDQDDPDLPEPWIDFFLLAHSNDIGDQRAATVDDLRLAGFVPTADLDRAMRVIAAARELLAAERSRVEAVRSATGQQIGFTSLNYRVAASEEALSRALAAYDAPGAGGGEG
jgi:hypothetical protein